MAHLKTPAAHPKKVKNLRDYLEISGEWQRNLGLVPGGTRASLVVRFTISVVVTAQLW
jgi:hypothetical protein